MEGKTILIGSKLPMSLVLKHPLDPTNTVTIRGLNAAAKGTNGQPISVPFVTTEISLDYWIEWKLANNHKSKPFKPLASGAIFEAKTEEAANKVYREREEERTGLEPANSRDYGVKKASDKD